MHEARLMRDLMTRITGVAAGNGGGRVAGVHVWLGALSHFTPHHFAEHFVDESAGSIAEGAVLTCDMSDDPTHADALTVRLISIELAPD